MKTWTPIAFTLSCLFFGHVSGEEEGGKDALLSSSNEEIEKVPHPSSSHQQMRKRQHHLFSGTTPPSDSNTEWPTFSPLNWSFDSWPTYSPTTPCIGPDPPNCGCGYQADYRGTIHKTVSGITCQNWRDQYPHIHPFFPWPNEDEDYRGLKENYCRNPYGKNFNAKERAWCYTTDTNVEWEYCEVPYCPLLPTLSPSPSISKMPSDTPTLSSLPSTLPSSSPTYTGGCMDLTISMLLPAKTFTSLDLTLRVTTTTSDGTEMNVEIPYELNSDDANSITNNRLALDGEESFCLPTGTYTLSYDGSSVPFWFEFPYWFNGWGVNRTLFTLSSSSSTDDEDERTIIACGDLLHDGAISFDLPASTSSSPSHKKCVSENVFTPMQCYQKAFNYTAEYDGSSGSTEEIDQNVWFDQECGSLLSDACKDKSNVLGFENGAMDDFCAFFECAYPDPNGTFPSCECFYRIWDCNHGAGCGSYDEDVAAALECCESSGSSCDCVLKQRCNEGIGNPQKCSEYAQYCCLGDNVDDDGNECKCNYFKHACLGTLRRNKDLTMKDLIEDESCMQSDEYCFDCEESIFALDSITLHSSQCESACTFWEGACLANPGPVCDLAADRCCSSYDPFCLCEFRDHVKSKTDYAIYYTNCGALQTLIPAVNREKAKQSLVNIYQEYNGENWLNREGWLTDTPHCDWYGITCDNSEGTITAIDLSFNNVTGQFDRGELFNSSLNYLAEELLSFPKLNSLILTGNALHGELKLDRLYDVHALTRVDVAENNLSGEAQLLVSPTIQQLNISHNRFTSILPIREFRKGYHTLVDADLSHNNINQDCSEILTNVPPNIRALRFTGNSIYGQLPSPLPVLNDLRILYINNNNLSGTVPPVSSSFPMIEFLNLANQTYNNSSGLIGRIPARWSNLIDLKLLDLSYNRLTNNIPAELGSLPSLQILNVSDNMLGGDTLPDEFGKLAANLMVLDASNNQFSGLIPSPALSNANANFYGVIKLKGNTNISSPAPLSLCGLEFFDLTEDTRLCPRERAALKDLYESTKGNEWTDSENWLSEHTFGCTWKGVVCNENQTIIGLNLTHNGLSGKLTSSIKELASLETLDLSDNDIKGYIPEEIGLLQSLKRLRLSNNAFSLTIPSSLGNLTQLELLHLQGNRLSGVMPAVNTDLLTDTSAFITDCGLPSEFESAMICDACTMCCNSKSECHDTKPDRIQELDRKGFGSYAQFAWVFFLLLLGYALLVITISYICDLRQERTTGRSLRRQSVIGRDNKYAINTIGGGSVYQYFLGKRVLGWLFAAAVVTIQIVALLIFVHAAMKNFTDDVSDFIYSWKCPRNSLECINDNDLDWLGWLVFAVLMAAHCLKDLINGMKLLVLCGKRRHGRNSRMRFFVAGLCLTFVSLFTVYASTVYNNAIARSNTDIIVNAVIILFVMDMDEYFYDAISAASLFWSAEKSTHRQAREDNSLDDKKYDDSTDVEIPQAVNQSLIKQKLSGQDGQLEMCMQELDRMKQSNMRLEESNKRLEESNMRLEESNMRLEERMRQLEKLVLAPNQSAHDSS